MLALTLGLAAPAGAQTIDSTHIVEGETKTFTVTGIPASWGNLEPDFGYRTTGSTVSHGNAVTCSTLHVFPSWDICRNSALSARTWDSATRTYTFELQARADSVSDSGETAVYRLEPDSSLNLAYHQDFTITIDEPVTVAFSASSYRVEEGDTLAVGVTLSAARSAATPVNIFISPTTAGGDGTDFDGSPFTITVPAGQTTATGTVATTEDSLREDDETFNMLIMSGQLPTGVTAGTPLHATATIEDDEPDPVLSVSLSPTSGNEGDSGDTYATVAVTLSPALATANTDFLLCIKGTGTATFRTAQGSNAADFDLVTTNSNTGLTVDASNCHATQVPVTHGSVEAMRLRIIGDTGVEADETAVVELRRAPGTPSQVTISPSAGTATYTIEDDDTPTLSVSLSPTAATEGDSGDTYSTVAIALAPTRSAATDFLLCVKNTGTATFRTAQGAKAKDFDLVHFGSNTGLTLDGSNCHAYTIGGGSGSSSVRLRIFGDTDIESDETAVVELRRAAGTPSGVAISSTAGTATYTIESDDHHPPEPTLSLVPPATTTVAEGGEPVEFALDVSAPGFTPMHGYAHLKRSGTANKYSDYRLEVLNGGDGPGWRVLNPAASLLPVPHGRERLRLRMVPLVDSLTELDETVILTLRPQPQVFRELGLPYTRGTPHVVKLTLTSTDVLTVTLARDGAARVDEGGTARFTLTATPAPREPLLRPLPVTVEVVDSGSFAASGQSGVREVTVGTDGTGTFTVATIDDNTAEAHGTLTATLLPGAYNVGAEREAVVRVSDDDIVGDLNPEIHFSALPEGAGVDFNLRLSKPLDGDQTLTLPLTVGGTAVRGTDYRLVCVESRPAAGAATCNGFDGASPSVTFHGAHMTSHRATGPLRLEAIEDGTAESSETVTLRLGGGGVDTTTLKDAPTSVTLTFTRATYSVRENDGTFQPILRVDAAPGRAITVPLVFTDITATAGADYETLATVTFPANGGVTHSPDIPLIDDTAYEGDETFRMAIDASRLPDWVTLGTHGEAVVTIQDDDTTGPAMWLSPSKVTVDEGLTGTYTVRLATEPTGTVTVAIASDNADVTTSPAQLAFNRSGTNQWDTPQTVTVSAAHDAGDNAADDAATLTHTASGGGYAGITGTVAVAVNDDDTAGAPPGVTVSTTSLSLAEGGAAGSYTVVLDAAPSANVTVTATSDDADAVKVHASGGTPGASATLTFTPTTWSQTRTLTVTPQDDADADDESVTIAHTLSNTGGYAGVTAASVTVAVDDDETPSVPSACDPDDVQGDVEGYVLETQHGTAHVERWKRVLAAFGVDNGATAMTAAEAQQMADQFSPSRWNPVVTVLACLERGTGTGPLITVTGGAGITEGGNVRFTVSASPAPAANLTVTLTVDDDATSDFLSPGHQGTQSVTIQANQTSATLTLPTVSDAIDEPDGSVRATVAGGTNYRIGTPSTATVAVGDDDDPPRTPEVRIDAGAAVTEGGTATFSLSATPAPTSPLTVEVQVTESGAFAQGGQTGTRQATVGTGGTGTLTVTTVNDTADEPNGSLTATVTSGTGYDPHPSHGAATVAVLDNDVTPVVRIAGGAAITEGGTATFTLTATPAPASALTVGVQVTQSGAFAQSGQTGTKPVTVGTDGAGTLTVVTVNDNTDEPNGSVTATVQAGTGYTAHSTNGSATVAVADNDPAPGVPVVSIGDARARESDRFIRFTVRLSRAADKTVNFWVRTRESSPVSAREGVDYYPVRALLYFLPGQTERWFTVGLANDSHDEGDETFEVKVGAVHGGRAVLGDNVGVGTIENDDPMPKAWLARFGRTAAEQALDGIAGRMAAPRTAGARGTLAGQALAFGEGGAGGANDNEVIGSAGSPGIGGMGDGPAMGAARRGLSDIDRLFDGGRTGATTRTLTARELLLGSSFTATGEADATGGSLAFWGRAAEARFDGREGAFSLDGEATTAMLGTDYARGDWLVGLALMQSAGEGDYRDGGSGSVRCPQALDAETRRTLCAGAVREGDGAVEASLTAALPYASLQASERLALWGALGVGTGEVTLKTGMGQQLGADIDWTMAAAGLRGDVIAPPKEGSGLALALTSDALWARTNSDETHELAASDSDVTRLRLGLEGSWKVALDGEGSVTPKVEIGARHDGGDAETGFGVELGGGVVWSDPALGLSLDLSGRTLIAHGNDDLKDRGFAASLGFDPDPASARGPSLSLRQTLGGQAEGGLDALFRADPLSGRTGGGTATGRWQAEAAWGLPAFGGRFTASPHLGLSLGTGTRDYTLGWRLTPGTGAGAPELSLGVKAIRKEGEGAASEHAVGVELSTRW